MYLTELNFQTVGLAKAWQTRLKSHRQFGKVWETAGWLAGGWLAGDWKLVPSSAANAFIRPCPCPSGLAGCTTTNNTLARWEPAATCWTHWVGFSVWP